MTREIVFSLDQLSKRFWAALYLARKNNQKLRKRLPRLAKLADKIRSQA